MVMSEKLDFPSDSFDAVVTVGVLTVGHAPASSLDELVRITSPGGHIVCPSLRPARRGRFQGKARRVGICRQVEAQRSRSTQTNATEGRARRVPPGMGVQSNIEPPAKPAIVILHIAYADPDSLWRSLWRIPLLAPDSHFRELHMNVIPGTATTR